MPLPPQPSLQLLATLRVHGSTKAPQADPPSTHIPLGDINHSSFTTRQLLTDASALPQGLVPCGVPQKTPTELSVPTSELELALVRIHIRYPSPFLPHLRGLTMTSGHIFTLQPHKGVTSLQTFLVLKNKQGLGGCTSWRNVCVLVPLPVNPLHSSGPLSLLNIQAKWS